MMWATRSCTSVAVRPVVRAAQVCRHRNKVSRPPRPNPPVAMNHPSLARAPAAGYAHLRRLASRRGEPREQYSACPRVTPEPPRLLPPVGRPRGRCRTPPVGPVFPVGHPHPTSESGRVSHRRSTAIGVSTTHRRRSGFSADSRSVHGLWDTRQAARRPVSEGLWDTLQGPSATPAARAEDTTPAGRDFDKPTP
jgi:hypothetical protein